jgi:outer membrane protein OmpA-like peptidoglycan-associated protein
MKSTKKIRNSFPSQLALLVLASAVAIPALGQASAGTPQTTPPSTAQQPSPTTTTSAPPAREGFWGRVNPMARKKWVKKQTDPINDRLGELDGVTAKNAQDIKDVDARSQAGITKAQTTADAANQAATAAGQQAQQAGSTAQTASTHVDSINTTVNGLDQYHQISEVDIPFHGGVATLSKAAKQQLDDFATSLSGHQGYIVEVEARSPGAGSLGIQNSERLAEAVNRYLVTEHEIPVYRLHAVALGNVPPTDTTQTAQVDNKPAKPARVRTSSVHLRLMENSLAAQGAASPQGVASSTGAERP